MTSLNRIIFILLLRLIYNYSIGSDLISSIECVKDVAVTLDWKLCLLRDFYCVYDLGTYSFLWVWYFFS